MLHENTTTTIQQNRNQIQNEQYQQKLNQLIPLSFKGMILKQIWKKCYKNVQLYDSQSDLNLSKFNIKRKNFIRWYFITMKQKLIKQTILKVLCQQSISKGCVFYRFMNLISISIEQKEKQQLQQQSQIQKLTHTFKEKQLQTDHLIETKQVQNILLKVHKHDLNQINQQRISVNRINKIPKQDSTDRLIKQLENQMFTQFKYIDKMMQKLDQTSQINHIIRKL